MTPLRRAQRTAQPRGPVLPPNHRAPPLVTAVLPDRQNGRHRPAYRFARHSRALPAAGSASRAVNKTSCG
jgi:hypothetical protein